MNITKYIRFFQRERRKRDISSQAADLYVFLLTECAENDGENPLRLADRYIIGAMGISRFKLRKARAQLVEEGFVQLITGDGTQVTSYRLQHVPAHAGVSIHSAEIDEQGKAIPKGKTKHTLPGSAPEPTPQPKAKPRRATPEKAEPTPKTTAKDPSKSPEQTNPVMPLPFEEVEALYHTHCPTLPRNTRRTAQQVEQVRQALLALHRATKDELREDLTAIFQHLEANEYAHGQNDRINRWTGKPWVATFGWLFREEKNWRRFLHNLPKAPPRGEEDHTFDHTPKIGNMGLVNPLGLKDPNDIIDFNNALRFKKPFRGEVYYA